MKKTIIAGVFLLAGITTAQAGVPLNNVEGVGGIAFNPLAYTAGTSFDTTGQAPGVGTTLEDAIAKPQFGIWRIRLNDAKADWTADSVATTFFKRLEVSYGNEIIAAGAPNISKNNIGVKGLLVKENDWDTKCVPAVAVGAIYKNTSYAVSGDTKDHGYDYYAVATKLITQLPRPVLLSGGLRSTQGYYTGVFGFGPKRDLVGFGNADVILPGNLALGYEYEQGAKVAAGWKNANYQDIHLAWLANKNLTLVAAYVNTGNIHSTSAHGLGDGFVLSAHYAF